MDNTRDALPYYFVGLERDGRYLAECASLNVRLKAETFEDAAAMIVVCLREFLSPHGTVRHLLRSGLVYALMATRKLNSIEM